MVKAHTTLNIENDIIENAKRLGLNMSEIAENAIKEKCGKIDIEINRKIDKDSGKLLGESCFFCKVVYPYATKENPDIGLTWLWPDEKWICHKCLSYKSRYITT